MIQDHFQLAGALVGILELVYPYWSFFVVKLPVGYNLFLHIRSFLRARILVSPLYILTSLLLYSSICARGASKFGKANPLSQTVLMCTASLTTPVLVSETSSQSSSVTFIPYRTYVCNLMITFPIKYPTSWV